MSSWTYLKEKFNLDDHEAAVAEWQFGYCGDFRKSLWGAICLADEGNLDLLSKCFPVEVQGYRKFSEISQWWQNIEKKMGEQP